MSEAILRFCAKKIFLANRFVTENNRFQFVFWSSAMRIPSTFVHYSERGGAADSCEHLFVEVSWGGIFTYQSMPGRSQTFSWLNHGTCTCFLPILDYLESRRTTFSCAILLMETVHEAHGRPGYSCVYARGVQRVIWDTCTPGEKNPRVGNIHEMPSQPRFTRF